jgi:methionine synthase II (cobalamin-independent)
VTDVFLCKAGQLSPTSKRDLRKAGVVVVEVDDPSACQFIRSTETVSGDDMLWAAMDALKSSFGSYEKGEKQREQFALNIAKVVAAARETS